MAELLVEVHRGMNLVPKLEKMKSKMMSIKDGNKKHT
jgi:hypothetical protein